MSLFESILTILTFYLCPIIKWFLRKTTRLCELQRICYGEMAGAPRTCRVEKSLNHSRVLSIRKASAGLDCWVEFEEDKGQETAAIENMLSIILSVKKTKSNLHVQFVHSLKTCLHQIWGYKRLVHQVKRLQNTPYDPNNLSHEKALLQLWSLLQPGIPLLSRVTKQWQNIGFQGNNPATDFRGMGILGLENLLYFAREYNSAARHILCHTHHPKHGFYAATQPHSPTVRYSFAIMGINITHLAFKLLNDGSAKTFVFNLPLNSSGFEMSPKLSHFHQFFCFLFMQFDKLWMIEKPKNIMEFNRIRDLFEKNIRELLSDKTRCLKVETSVDSV